MLVAISHGGAPFGPGLARAAVGWLTQDAASSVCFCAWKLELGPDAGEELGWSPYIGAELQRLAAAVISLKL
jgi:hypothetical protein